MGAYSDGLLMIVIAGIGAFLLYRGFRSWVRKPFSLRSGIGFEMNEEILEHPAVDMLEQAGYEVVSDKLKVPLTFRVDGELLHSRLFIRLYCGQERGILSGKDRAGTPPDRMDGQRLTQGTAAVPAAISGMRRRVVRGSGTRGAEGNLLNDGRG
ncbi:hypothetical protein HMSSN139_51160 [Paenibacillus sp. HMSSN-139]|nr:hypothetical protein HMSSN139_51160 [Paenibacillus sp. HMSSN-139]